MRALANGTSANEFLQGEQAETERYIDSLQGLATFYINDSGSMKSYEKKVRSLALRIDESLGVT